MSSPTKELEDEGKEEKEEVRFNLFEKVINHFSIILVHQDQVHVKMIFIS